MKEAFRLIYGKEWKWFLSLALAMKLRLIWFLVSFVMLCALSFERSDVLCVCRGCELPCQCHRLERCAW